MKWLTQALTEAGLWPVNAPMNCRVVLRERFEVYLIQKPGRDEPALVAKVARDEYASERLRHEHEYLNHLLPRASEPIARSLPRSFGSLVLSGREMWVRSGISGAHPSFREPRSFRRVAEWLSEFSTAGRSAPLTKEEYLDRLHVFPLASGPRARLAVEIATALAGRVPAVWEHGDLNPSNVLLRRDAIGVIDWVWGRERGIPLFDWFDFCIHAAVGESRARRADHTWREVFCAFLDNSSAVHDRVLDGSRVTAVPLGLDDGVVSALLIFYASTRLWSLLAYRSRPEADEVFAEASRAAAKSWGAAWGWDAQP